MSRRANPADNRIELNRQTLKNLVKLEANKTCADCKRNKQPRWASWNLGIFICIRCSGIHRGMGTHISRVKSVDLDSWTDEQTENMLKWGNARANKYWESKLAEGHTPSEAKIENFIRTKYESKRWVMEGPKPDPSTLGGDRDDDVPLNIVQERAKLDRSSSLKQAQASTRIVSQPKAAPVIDLFGDDISAPARPSTGPPVGTQPPPKAGAAPPKATKPADSLLGLDFFGTSSAAPPPRPSSASLINAGNTQPAARPDLKQSILSLYASAPKPTPQPQPQPQQSPAPPSAFGGMEDAFGSLNLSSPAPPPKPVSSPFDDLMGLGSSKPAAPTSQGAPPITGGGNFFSQMSKAKSGLTIPQQPQVSKPAISNLPNLFSDPAPAAKPVTSPSASNDLFDLTAPSAPGPSTQLAFTSPSINSTSSQPTQTSDSPFNLSSKPAPSQTLAPAKSSNNTFSSFGGGVSNPWGADDNVWGAPESAPPASTKPAISMSMSMGMNTSTSAQRTKPSETDIAGDEDFGGWSTAPPSNTFDGGSSGAGAKPSLGGVGNDDLFNNVWQ